jgi:hypothetical protein
MIRQFQMQVVSMLLALNLGLNVALSGKSFLEKGAQSLALTLNGSTSMLSEGEAVGEAQQERSYAEQVYGSSFSSRSSDFFRQKKPGDEQKIRLVRSSLHGASTRFRTETCGDSNAVLNSQLWTTIDPSNAIARDAEKHDTANVLDLLEISNVSTSKASPRVACLVYSHAGNRRLQRESYATWGQDCDEFLLFSDETYTDTEAGFTTIEVHGEPEQKESYNAIIQKLRAAYAVIQQRVAAGSLSFDFLTVSPDDAFWIIPNLRANLAANHEILERARLGLPIVYGHIFQPSPGYKFASGGGYVLNMAALNAYMSDPQTQELKGPAEDLQMGRILSKIDGVMVHGQDETGEHLFHVLEPTTLPGMYSYTNKKDWGYRYEFFLMGRLHGKRGLDLISKHTTLFHRLTGAYRLAVHDFLYSRHC